MAAITLLQANLKQLKVAASNVSADQCYNALHRRMSTITTIIMGNFVVIIGNYCSQISNVI